MKIYTRGGDQGKTTLIGRKRRFKDDLRVEAYGSTDEAGAFIGLAVSLLAQDTCKDLIEVLMQVQQTLWDVGADLAAVPEAEYTFRTPSDAAATLEPLIDKYKDEADEVTQFILRGGHTASAALHVACTVVRRAERRVVKLLQIEPIHPPTLQYLNRLSDLLFVLARTANAREHHTDIIYTNSPEVFREGK